MRFGILGPLEVADEGGRELALGGRRQRSVLAILLLHANEAVSADRLVEDLWSGRPPASAATSLQAHISRLRRAIGEDRRIMTTGGGYLIRVAEGELDRDRFERLVGEGDAAIAAGKWELASGRLREALSLWRGAALSDFEYDSFAQAEIARLEELHVGAMEQRIEAELALGREAQVVGDLERLVREHPYRERLRGQLMLALYRSGRQADALAAYQAARRALVEELGIDPSAELRELEQGILRHDPSLERRIESDSGQARRPGPTALPQPATTTIGRERDVEKVSMLLGRGARLVTLTGPGGVGKTRLALAVASSIRSRFRDGACWVELAGVARSADVPATIARALGLVARQGESLHDALRHDLMTKRLLLVLDNFEHVLNAAGLVGELLGASPALVVVLTSREALRLAGEHRVVVAPLAVPADTETTTVVDIETADATALFVAAAQRRDDRFELTNATAPAIARICARLDGLPLALELAAARTGILGVDELASRLDDAVTLVGPGVRDAPARHTTLGATIEWSYRLLDPELQALFARFAVFAGGATLEAAEKVLGVFLATLEALTAKSLLDRREQPDGSTRVVMLETVREYALGRLAEDREQDSIRRRHLEHYSRLVEQQVPRLSTHDEEDALAAIDRELDNIDAALSWALQTAPREALRLCGLLGDYWLIRGDPDGLGRLDAALRTAGEDAPAEDRARAEFGRARQHFLRLEHSAANAAANAALELYQLAANHAGISEANCELVFISMVLGDDNACRKFALAARRHARLAGDDAFLGKIEARLIGTLPADERPEALEQAAELLTHAGDYREVARAYGSAAFVALKEDRIAEAISLLNVALPAAERSASPGIIMLTLGNTGLANLFAGNFAVARDAFVRQLRLCARYGYRFGADEAFVGLGALSAVAGEPEKAARLLGSSRAMGYPTADDQSIDERLERNYFGPARARCEPDAWQRATNAGQAMPFDQAIADALERVTEPAARPET